MKLPEPEPLPLWPGRAPGAMGDGPEHTPCITPFPIASAGPVPAVLVFPGGGYSFRAEHEGAPIARWLNGLGLAAFVVSYRVAPYRHPVPLWDAQRAIRTVRHRARAWNVDPSRVGIIGFSAGGHLAATAATRFDDGRPDAADPVDRASCRPDLAVLCYPVITFGPERHDGSMRCLLGPDPSEEERRALSAHHNVTPATPPVFLWHTAEDKTVPVENSLLFAAALARAKVPFALHVYPNGRHGLGLAEGHPGIDWTQQCAVWLREQGWVD